MHHGLYFASRKDYKQPLWTAPCQSRWPNGGRNGSRHIETTKAKPGRDRMSEHTSNEKGDGCHQQSRIWKKKKKTILITNYFDEFYQTWRKLMLLGFFLFVLKINKNKSQKKIIRPTVPSKSDQVL